MGWLETRRSVSGLTREKGLFLLSLCAAGIAGYLVLETKGPETGLDTAVYARLDTYAKPGEMPLYRPEELSLKKLLEMDRSPFFPWRPTVGDVTMDGKTPEKTPSNGTGGDGIINIPPKPTPDDQDATQDGKTNDAPAYQMPMIFRGVYQDKEGLLIVVLVSRKSGKVYELAEGQSAENALLRSITKNEIILQGEDRTDVIRKDEVSKKFSW